MEYPMTDDQISIANGIQFLEECFDNGKKGKKELYKWFCEKRNEMTDVIRDLRAIEIE